jgi:hypothetical protein
LVAVASAVPLARIAGNTSSSTALNHSRRLGRRSGKAQPDIVAPSRHRLRQGLVERLSQPIADIDGAIARPYRAIDILGAMERRGAITQAMRAAGEHFRERFAAASLDPLRAASFEWRPKGSVAAMPGLRAEAARQAVWRALCAVGGLASPAGSVLWHVIGFERTLKEWALQQGWAGRRIREETASGILIATLGVLEAHFATTGES